MTTSPLLMVQAASQSSAAATAAGGVLAQGAMAAGLQGQTNFLTLLLGQIDGSEANINLNFALTQPQVQIAKGIDATQTQLQSFSPEQLNQLMKLAGDALSSQSTTVGQNQETINSTAQKLRDYLSGLIEFAQTTDKTANISSPSAVAGANASQQNTPNADQLLAELGNEQQSLSQTENLSNGASKPTIEAMLQALKPVDHNGQFNAQEDILAAIVAPETLSKVLKNANASEQKQQQQQALTIQTDALATQSQTDTLTQAVLLSSGLTIDELGTIQSKASIQAAENTLEFIGKDAPLFGLTQATQNLEQTSQRRNLSNGRQDGVSGSLSNKQGMMNGSLGQNTDISHHLASMKVPDTPNLPKMPGLPLPPQSSDLALLDGQIDPSLQNLQELGADTAAARTLANPATTSAQHASQPHPAAQNVAVQIQKHALQNGNREFTIEMDPPELGRVEVNLRMGKDKTVQAHMIVEKPESYMLLQRDSGVLQKALQEIGLDASNDSFTFDLAKQDSDGSGGFDQSGNKKSPDQFGQVEPKSEVIETQMTEIMVDPETGIVRVNLLA